MSARALLLLLTACLLAGCAAPRRRSPPPPPPAPPRPAPPPEASYDPSAAPPSILALDELGRARLGERDVTYLLPELQDLRRAHGRRVALQIEAPARLAWRDVAAAYDACVVAGLSNLHWKVADDERPALRLPRFPERDELRSGRVLLSVEGGQGRHTWEPTLRPRDEEPLERPLTTAELLVFVREARARRVEVAIQPDVPFGVVYETLEALRDTGTIVALRAER